VKTAIAHEPVARVGSDLLASCQRCCAEAEIDRDVAIGVGLEKLKVADSGETIDRTIPSKFEPRIAQPSACFGKVRHRIIALDGEVPVGVGGVHVGY